MKDVNASGEVTGAAVAEPVDGCLRIPEGEEYILEESYHAREDIEEIYLPSSMRVIGPIAFAECPKLKRVHFNEGLEEIGDGAFLGAGLLREVKLPQSLRTIGPMAFWGCGLESAVVPGSVTTIGECAFWDCPELTMAEVLNPRAEIGQDAFGDCPRLVQGYIAPGFPAESSGPSDLLYTLLWSAECDRHEENGSTAEKAKAFIASNPGLIVEHILRAENTAAMKGIIRYGLLDAASLDEGLRASVEAGYTELSSLFLTARAAVNTNNKEEDEFEL